MNNSLIKNKVLNYNNFNNVSNKMKFDDYVYDKYTIIHQKLYNDALNKLIEERNYNRDEYRFIEIKQNEYYQPSLVYVQSIYPPFNTEKISLEKYWDTYEFKEEFKNLDESFFDEDVNVNALEVINIDYINGLIKLKDKYTGRIFTKKTKYLNDNLKYSKENFSLENTFSYQIYNNKIYK